MFSAAYNAVMAPDLVPELPDPTALQDSLRAQLSAIVAHARRDADMRDLAMQGDGFFGQFLIYSGAFLSGAGRMVGDVADMGGAILSLPGSIHLPNMANLSTNQLAASAGQVAAGGGWSLRHAAGSIASAVASSAGVAQRTVLDALDTIDGVARDPETWAILVEFQRDFWRALHPTVLVEYAGALGLNLMFSLVTGGAGAALAFGRGSALAYTLSRRFSQIAGLLKQLGFLYSRAFRQRYLGKLKALANRFANRYLDHPMIRKAVSHHQTAPLCASVLWVPRVRRLPFFGVSQWFENVLDPKYAGVLKDPAKGSGLQELVDRQLTPALQTMLDELAGRLRKKQITKGGGYVAGQHGRCAEPVAISRALMFLMGSRTPLANRAKGPWSERFDAPLPETGGGLSFKRAARQLRGALIFSVDIGLKGSRRAWEGPRGNRVPKWRHGTKSYHKRQKKYEHRETDDRPQKTSCRSCELLLEELRIVELFKKEEQGKS